MAMFAGNVLPDVMSFRCSGKMPLLAKPRWLPKIAFSCRKSAMMLALKPCLPISPQPTSAFKPPLSPPPCCVTPPNTLPSAPT